MGRYGPYVSAAFGIVFLGLGVLFVVAILKERKVRRLLKAFR